MTRKRSYTPAQKRVLEALKRGALILRVENMTLACYDPTPGYHFTLFEGNSRIGTVDRRTVARLFAEGLIIILAGKYVYYTTTAVPDGN